MAKDSDMQKLLLEQMLEISGQIGNLEGRMSGIETQVKQRRENEGLLFDTTKDLQEQISAMRASNGKSARNRNILITAAALAGASGREGVILILRAMGG